MKGELGGLDIQLSERKRRNPWGLSTGLYNT
jgi:hypothetical protein